MAYTTEKIPYVRILPVEDTQQLPVYINQELYKIELSMDRIMQLFDETDTRITSGGSSLSGKTYADFV